MKQLKGTPLTDLKVPIIGKISFDEKNVLQKKDCVLVSDTNIKCIKPGYAAVLLSKPINSILSPSLMCDYKELSQLNNGDIVIIEPSGNINVVYEKETVHNALFVTERCNASCVMCPQPAIAQEKDNMDVIFKIISLMDKNTELLGITGGEPTLLGDKLIDIILACKKSLPKTSLVLLTNAMILDNFDYVKRLEMIKHPDFTIDIPLYSDTDTIHNSITRVNGFYRTIQGIYNLAKFNHKIGIRIVINKLNYERLPQLSEFIYHNFPFVYYIAFMQMEVEGMAKKNIDQIWIDPYDYNEQLEESILYLRRRGMSVSIYNSQLCILPRSLWPHAKKSISTWKNIYLDSCRTCDYYEQCGGFFASSLDIHSNHIKSIKMN